MIMKVLLTSLLLVHECSASNVSSGNVSSEENVSSGNSSAPVRTGLGACNMNHTTALMLLADGNMSMVADLGPACGGCVAFSDPDMCPCMGADICQLSGCVLTDDGCEAPRDGLGSCNATHSADLLALEAGNFSVIGALGDCGVCMTDGGTPCPCMAPDLCAAGGCIVDGDQCAEQRAYAGSCGLADAATLLSIDGGNSSAVVDLSTNCSMCIVAGDDDVCPCLSADLCSNGCMMSGGHCKVEVMRPNKGSCTMVNHSSALMALQQGDVSQIANLGAECGPCILFDTDDTCPCMEPGLCPIAGCFVDGEACVETLPVTEGPSARPSPNSCGLAQAAALTSLQGGDTSQMANLGEECGPCIMDDTENVCPCMDSTLCSLAGCTPEQCLPPPPVTEGPAARPSPNSCTLAQAAALTALSGGDTSQIANLGEECGPCIMDDTENVCPCMDSTLCSLAGCTPESCVYSGPAVTTTTAAETTTTARAGTTTKAVYKPTTKVAVKAVTTFAEPLTEEAQESVKTVFCDEVKATVEAEYADCDECTVFCTITEVTTRRRLLAEVSYELGAEVSLPTAEASIEDATATFGATFQEAMETAITTSPTVVAANGGVAPTVEVKETEVEAITTTTTTTTAAGTTTDSIDFSSAPAVSCVLAVLVPVLL